MDPTRAICCTPCPYQAFSNYIELCPDPFGAARDEKRKSNLMLKSLYLMRVLTTRGIRTLTELPLGKYYSNYILLNNNLFNNRRK